MVGVDVWRAFLCQAFVYTLFDLASLGIETSGPTRLPLFRHAPRDSGRAFILNIYMYSLGLGPLRTVGSDETWAWAFMRRKSGVEARVEMWAALPSG